ncbi:TetR/AcrR family transcriptional regulator [Paenibacillus glycinis]|uniref:TetR family transcriptional regulator n=1 Tax=Paenibacillus glycinis TaxID=2697035 RepID=A0ABW9XXA0_9BACL|nr:TetR/AcrR family transcriptional regulator [Paenibacillus glycinis]NBD27328.1 TetR family transcriptional regulator [Paenibacillus glycinis]
MQQRNERKDAARHREIILDTASQLFHEYGVEGVSMHQIAKSAGVGQGTLYRRYSSKAELCLELLTDSFSRFTSSVERYLAEAAGRSARGKLEGFVSLAIDYVSREIEWLNAIKPSEWCAEDRTSVFESDPFLYVTGMLKAILDEAVVKGETPPFDTEFAAFTATASFNPSTFFYLTKDRGCSVEEVKAKFVQYYDRLFFA